MLDAFKCLDDELPSISLRQIFNDVATSNIVFPPLMITNLQFHIQINAVLLPTQNGFTCFSFASPLTADLKSL